VGRAFIHEAFSKSAGHESVGLGMVRDQRISIVIQRANQKKIA
jgi:hypothetical protein